MKLSTQTKNTFCGQKQFSFWNLSEWINGLTHPPRFDIGFSRVWKDTIMITMFHPIEAPDLWNGILLKHDQIVYFCKSKQSNDLHLSRGIYVCFVWCSLINYKIDITSLYPFSKTVLLKISVLVIERRIETKRKNWIWTSLTIGKVRSSVHVLLSVYR